VLLRLEFLTSYGMFSPRYPTEGDMPHQKLPSKKVGFPFRPHGDLFSTMLWKTHKGRYREHSWSITGHQVKRRGHVVVAEVRAPSTGATFLNIVLAIHSWYRTLSDPAWHHLEDVW
jgi:hypothetical protein